MCGICGQIGSEVNKSLIKKMVNVIRHRGPTKDGYYIDSQIELGVCRLAIIDLKKGDQPIYNEDKSIVIVFNGEIYNFPELKLYLEKKGHRFYTDSDTEVIIHLYEEFGDSFIKKLRGMFAFAIWDIKKKKLLLARDRLGIKPLYYTIYKDMFLFASEIKSILQEENIPREVDYTALNNFFTFRFVPGPFTMFKKIKKLQPGHILVYQNKKIRIKKYWDIKYSSSDNSETYYIKILRKLLKESIEMRLISEVPLGAYLSGGTDSSFVVGIMSTLMKESVKTFTIGFGDKRFDELKYANIVAEHFNTDHREFIVDPVKLETLFNIIWHFDEPIADPAAVPTYILSEMAKKHVTVVLTGEGGDELFAGYEQYKIMITTQRLQKLFPRFFLSKVIPKIVGSIPKKFLDLLFMYTSSLGNEAINRFSNYMNSLDDVKKSYLNIISIFTEEEKKKLYSGFTKKNTKKSNAMETVEPYFRDDSRNLLNKLLLFETKVQLPDNLLMKVDKMTMAKSVEARVPLLDHKLVEFAASIPTSLKLNGLTDKYILRKTMRGFLPRSIVNRKKHRFVVPIDAWFGNELKDVVNEILSKPNIEKRGFFNSSYIKHIINPQNKSSFYYSRQLWNLLVFEIWHKIYIEGDVSKKMPSTFDI